MTTIVNTPAAAPQSNGSDNSFGWVLVLLIILAMGVLFFIYGLPMLRRATTATQVNVPDKVDINVNTTK